MEGTDTINPPLVVAGGEKSKARDIVAAIKTLQQVERERRPADAEERTTLAQFGGFGAVALALFPNPVILKKQPNHEFGGYRDASWRKLGDELQSLLTPAEYESARATVRYAYYTSPIVMQAMHAALERLGVPADATVLEPGCGIGNFMAHAAEGMRFIGVEMDGLSGRIARALHPRADIRIEDFRDTKLPPLDAVIGNVPFENLTYDHHGRKFSLHDYFIAKSVNALKPGGILAVVTSHYTLDKMNAAAREHLAGQADFLGAVRLPSDAFKREGTPVVTDIVFLRKRASGREPHHAGEWLDTKPIAIEGTETAINQYFVDHPEMVLGNWSRENTLYPGSYSVVSNGDLAGRLKDADRRLPRAARSEAERANPPPAGEAGPRHLKDSARRQWVFSHKHRHRRRSSPRRRSAYRRGKLVRRRRQGHPPDRKRPRQACGLLRRPPQGTMARLKHAKSLAEIRMLIQARRVLQSQNEGWPEAAREAERRELNRLYDRFVAAYGPINKTTFTTTKDGGTIRRMPNLVKFREDPDAMLVMSLEEYDEATGKAEKAAIMKKDVVGPKPPITHVTSAEEGLLVSLDHRGAVDLPYIAKLYGKPEPEIAAELGDLIYRDPESKQWQTADAYLSGNVRDKLKIAERAGREYARNAEALRQVQPEDVLPGDIDANLVRPWIPEKDIQAFAAWLFNVPAESFNDRSSQKGCRLVGRAGLPGAAISGRDRRLRHRAHQRHGVVRACVKYEDAGHLRHRTSRRPRGTCRQPDRDA